MSDAFTEQMVQYRIRQIEIGKSTNGYKNYLSKILKRNPKNPEHPRTPDPYAPDSKRQFDGRLKAWKFKIKQYESGTEPGEPSACNSVLTDPPPRKEKDGPVVVERAPDPPTAKSQTSPPPKRRKFLKSDKENDPGISQRITQKQNVSEIVDESDNESCDGDEWMKIPGPVTLYLKSLDDLKIAKELISINQPGSIKIVKLFEDPDEWLNLNPLIKFPAQMEAVGKVKKKFPAQIGIPSTIESSSMNPVRKFYF